MNLDRVGSDQSVHVSSNKREPSTSLECFFAFSFFFFFPGQFKGWMTRPVCAERNPRIRSSFSHKLTWLVGDSSSFHLHHQVHGLEMQEEYPMAKNQYWGSDTTHTSQWKQMQITMVSKYKWVGSSSLGICIYIYEWHYFHIFHCICFNLMGICCYVN